MSTANSKGEPAHFRIDQMTSNSLKSRLVGVLLLSGTWVGTAASQGMTHPSTATVIRQQWESLAQEVVDKLTLAPHTKIALWVQPVADSVSAQNAFLENFLHRGYAPTLNPTKDSDEVKLTVAVLTDRTQMKEIAKDTYQRTVQTDIEPRTERSNGQSVEVLGVFHRALVDTVSAQEAALPLPTPSASGNEDATLFQRVVGPVIVLASSIIVVYLFFTVRS